MASSSVQTHSVEAFAVKLLACIWLDPIECLMWSTAPPTGQDVKRLFFEVGVLLAFLTWEVTSCQGWMFRCFVSHLPQRLHARLFLGAFPHSHQGSKDGVSIPDSKIPEAALIFNLETKIDPASIFNFFFSYSWNQVDIKFSRDIKSGVSCVWQGDSHAMAMGVCCLCFYGDYIKDNEKRQTFLASWTSWKSLFRSLFC